MPHVRGHACRLRCDRQRGAVRALSVHVSSPPWPRSGGSCQHSSGAAQTARTDAVPTCQPATSVQVYLASSLPLCSSLPRAGVRRALVLPWGAARRSGRSPLCSRACGALLFVGPVVTEAVQLRSCGSRGSAPRRPPALGRAAAGAHSAPLRSDSLRSHSAFQWPCPPRFPCRSRAGGPPTPLRRLPDVPDP